MTPRTRNLLGLGALVALVVSAWEWTACWRLGHDVAPHPLGYCYCRRCGMKAASLAEFGLLDDDGYVKPGWRA